MQTSLISKLIKIEPKMFHNYKKYIKEILDSAVGKTFSNDIGYISKIVKINDIQNYTIIKNDFSGCIIYNVFFTVEHYNPQINDEIICTIIQSNNILLATAIGMKIIIIDDLDLKINDKILIKVLCKEINLNSDYIKIVGQFINQLNT